MRYPIIALVVALLCLAFSASAEEKPPIIDMHLHSYDETNYFVAPDTSGTMAPPTVEAHFEATYQSMRDNNVVLGVISNSRSSEATWMSQDVEDRFLRGYGWFRPSENGFAEFKALAEAGEVAVFGEIGAFYSGMTLADPYFEPYLAICEELGIPVAIHTGGGPSGITYRGAPNARIEQGNPYHLEDMLVKYPNLKVYLMHAGEAFYEEAARLMIGHRQVYADLGVVLWIHPATRHYGEEFLRLAKEFGLLDRVMFGSDQMVWPHAIEASIRKLESFDFLTEQDRRDILYNNAARFLELTDEQIEKHHR